MAPESVGRSGGVAHARGLRTTLAVGLLVLGAGDLTAIATILLPRCLASRSQPAPALRTLPTTETLTMQAAPLSTLDAAPALDGPAADEVRPAVVLPPAMAVPAQVEERPAAAEVPAAPPSWPRLLFGQNTAGLSAEARATLDRLSDYLKQNPNVEVVLEGHTDNQGEPDVNNWLSRNRAIRAKERLVAQGINPAQVEIHNYGAARPLVPNRSPETRAQNRRVDITLRERSH